MARYQARRPLELSHGSPSGPRWTEYTRRLWASWLRSGQPCYYCGHGFTVRGETAHLISPIVAPQLAWAPDNLRPSHGKTSRRCPIPECDLNCNWLAHNSPDAPFEIIELNGAKVKRDLPFDGPFLARQLRERAQFLAKRGNSPQFPENPRQTRRNPGGPPVVPFRSQDAGRPW